MPQWSVTLHALRRIQCIKHTHTHTNTHTLRIEQTQQQWTYRQHSLLCGKIRYSHESLLSSRLQGSSLSSFPATDVHSSSCWPWLCADKEDPTGIVVESYANYTHTHIRKSNKVLVSYLS